MCQFLPKCRIPGGNKVAMMTNVGPILCMWPIFSSQSWLSFKSKDSTQSQKCKCVRISTSCKVEVREISSHGFAFILHEMQVNHPHPLVYIWILYELRSKLIYIDPFSNATASPKCLKRYICHCCRLKQKLCFSFMPAPYKLLPLFPTSKQVVWEAELNRMKGFHMPRGQPFRLLLKKNKKRKKKKLFTFAWH